MSLNPAQTSRLAATLQNMEEWLYHIDWLVTAPNQGAQGVLRRMQRTLTDEQRQVLRELGAATRAEVARAAERFALPCREQDETQIIDAVLSTMWVALWVALQKTGPCSGRRSGRRSGRQTSSLWIDDAARGSTSAR